MPSICAHPSMLSTETLEDRCSLALKPGHGEYWPIAPTFGRSPKSPEGLCFFAPRSNREQTICPKLGRKQVIFNLRKLYADFEVFSRIDFKAERIDFNVPTKSLPAFVRSLPTATLLVRRSYDQLQLSAFGAHRKPSHSGKNWALAACVVVVSYILVAIMVKKVQPTFVFLSPYKFQNCKKVKIAAKHGALLFVVIFVICMSVCYFNTNNLWVLFLPQVVFYILTYIIGCISDNKTFQQIQVCH
uniref:Vesicle transport protein n=1 Tax=Panagrellus redivivus TaxID=6233 RepID=A0A7E4ZWX7_PANRE